MNSSNISLNQTEKTDRIVITRFHSDNHADQLLMAVKIDQDTRMLNASVAASASMINANFAPTDDTLPDWFNDDTNLSYYEALDPKHGLLGKLMAMIKFMEANPGNLKAPQVLMSFLQKLDQANPALAETLLNATVNGTTLIDALISSQIKAEFFNSGNLDLDKSGFFEQLSDMFKDDAPLYAQATASIANWHNKWQDFVDANTKDGQPIMSYDEYSQIATMFFDNFNLSSWFQTFANQEMFQQMLKTAGPYGAALLLALLMNSLDQDKFDTVGYYGNAASWMKRRTTDVAALADLWNKGQWTEDSAMDFIQKIKAFLFKMNDPKADSIAADIDAALGEKTGLLSMQYTDNSTTPPTTYKIEDLYEKALGGDAASKTLLCNALKSWSMPSDPTQTVPTQFTQIEGFFKTATSDFSDQSQTITTALQKITSDEQAYDGIEGKSLSNWIDLINDIIKKFASA